MKIIYKYNNIKCKNYKKIKVSSLKKKIGVWRNIKNIERWKEKEKAK